MKQQCKAIIDQQSSQIIELGQTLFKTPELGFKEFKTKQIILDFLKNESIDVEKEYFETGFQISIGNGKPHIGLICELDAIPTPHHPYAKLDDYAAHSCGHSTQVAIMINAFMALKKLNCTKNGGKITLFFTPAEEFTDMEYRKQLKQEHKIKYYSGKVNMLVNHIFDDVDVCIHLHAMTGNPKYNYGIHSHLAGFVYKKFTFKGRAAHAGFLPHYGINALNAFALFQSAVGMLRETFVDEDKNRIHGIVTHGGDTVNTIPEKVVYEGYVRSFNTTKLKELNAQLTHTAKYCAMALNGECVVEDEPGYLPFEPSYTLGNIALQNILEFSSKDNIIFDEKSIAAGDIGDVSAFVPSIQFGYTGFSGIAHGKDFMVENVERVYIEPAKIVAMSCIDLLENSTLIEEIKKEFKPTMTMETYLSYLNKE